MHDRRKKRKIFHVNMLRAWHLPTSNSYFMEEIADENQLEDDIPSWKDNEGGAPVIGSHLDREQRMQLQALLMEFADVFKLNQARQSWQNTG